ncbi:MAG: DUF1846 domain-containing protein [Clostridia bacterium]|nr:DUF1846 domain-containing protein [Clostridia bacterium]
MKRIGFDSEKYIRLQSQHIRERIEQFGGKLYLEFGGKLFDDYHASRVLPGFAPDNKIKMLLELRDQAEVVIAINAQDIEKNKRRGDLGITYDTDVMRLIDIFRDFGLYVGSIALTQYAEQPSAAVFEKRMTKLGLKVYRHYSIPNYPSDLKLVVSDEGYGRNDYIKTTRSLVVVTGPGPGSGKMATCLSQLYHEHKRGVKAGYAKFETFPIWNLPLKHPVNLAYEAATADLNDVNMIDPFHLEAYGETTVNYNRDVEIFPVLRTIFERIYGECPYKSPTDMGVNMVGMSISDDEVCREASRQEIIRRYFKAACQVRQGLSSGEEVGKIELLMSALKIEPENRAVVPAALKIYEATGKPAAAIELPDGRIVTGKTTDLFGPVSAAMLNALKALAGIPDEVKLIAPTVIGTIQTLKTDYMKSQNPRLHTDEMLVALAISAATDENAMNAMQQLASLEGCDIHCTVILSSVDDGVFKRLNMNLTCEPTYEKNNLYHK